MSQWLGRAELAETVVCIRYCAAYHRLCVPVWSVGICSWLSLGRLVCACTVVLVCC